MASIVEQLAKVLAANGITLGDLAKVMPSTALLAAQVPTETPAPRRQRKRGEFRHAVASASAAQVHGKYTYGNAPAAGYSSARGVHRARLEALEAAMPGFTKVTYVFSVGKNAKGQLEKHLDAIHNTPWTWIEMPGGKLFAAGGLTPEQTRETLAKLGYGFSPSNNLWATDSRGCPVRRMRHYQAERAGRTMLNQEE